jgi:hypothetical protein
MDSALQYWSPTVEISTWRDEAVNEDAAQGEKGSSCELGRGPYCSMGLYGVLQRETSGGESSWNEGSTNQLGREEDAVKAIAIATLRRDPGRLMEQERAINSRTYRLGTASCFCALDLGGVNTRGRR